MRRNPYGCHPCPSTGSTSGACPGYVIDHTHALKHGGADEPWNMQWQTEAAAKTKDRWEWAFYAPGFQLPSRSSLAC